MQMFVLSIGIIKEDDIMDMGSVFKMQQYWQRFTRNHPKFPMFLNAVKSRGMQEGTVCALAITYPDGTKMETNIKITADDMEIFRELGSMRP